MNKNTMTVEHMIDVAEACQACEDLQSKHAILHAAGQTEEELDTMWSKRDDIFWAHNFGGMTTRDAVYKGWAGGLAGNSRYFYKQLVKRYPEVEGMDPRPLMECAVHMLGSSIIEVADDGQSARCSWYTPGVIFSTLNFHGKREGIWIWERYGNDFVKEDGEWKIFSQHVCNDYGGPFDVINFAANAYQELLADKPRQRPAPPVDEDGDSPAPPVADLPLFYSGYTPVQPPQNSVAWPAPYPTFDREHGSYCCPFAEGEYKIEYPIPPMGTQH